MNARCRIELLGGLQVLQPERTITRFRSRQTGALLAHLAYYLQQQHPREVLIEVLWPEYDLDAGRNSLSVALSSLRHQLEPPGVATGTVLAANRTSVGLNPAVVMTDVAEFEATLDSAAKARSRTGRAQLLTEAVELYGGELLPGYYEEWILAERDRLAERYLQALRQLMSHLEKAGNAVDAVDYAKRAVGADPLREEIQCELMRLYAAVGQPSAALRQYQDLEQILRKELGETPSAATRQLVEEIRRSMSGVQASRRSGDQRPTTNDAANVQRAPERPPTRTPRRLSVPTGTVTFLLTDIEGSTVQWEQPREAFQAALASYHALLRRAFRRHGGYEIQKADDSFLVAFERAGDALACAVAGQQALAAHEGPAAEGHPKDEPLRVRMALRTGDVELRQGEYSGLVLQHAERMLLTAHGGQILCSEITAGLLLRGGIALLEPGVALSDLGVYRLRGLAMPEKLFQVDPQMAQREFPPPRAEAGHGCHLPLPFTRFFGRESELAQLRQMLLSGETRLVTLTGPGGSGKTRLALEVAQQLVEALRGAVWFIPLADLADPRLIADAVRDSLRLPRSPHMTPLEQVVEALSRQHTLLVLDNFEHLMTEGARLVRTLLEQAPTLTCLVTSRQRLGLEGEREFGVFPLPTPSGAATPERLSLIESVQLFVDRAQAVRPDFQVTKANALAVAELCQRLEGIPLAIELAAARAQVLTPAQMLAQLEHRLDFLVSRRRDAVTRHRTLRAAIAWGYQLLAPELQQFFARLSVFRGGWTLEAAEAVCAGTQVSGYSGVQDRQEPSPGRAEHPNTRTPGSLDTPDVLDYLAQLRECSLVLAEEGPHGMRFRMLETLREYAEEQSPPEERSVLEARYAAFYLTMAAEAEPRAGSSERWTGRADEVEGEWWERLEAERSNFHAALFWGLKHQPELALRLAVALGEFWYAAGHYTEGREAIERALGQAVDAPAQLRGRALYLEAGLADRQGDFVQARDLSARSLELMEGGGDPGSVANVRQRLAWAVLLQGDTVQAGALYQEVLADRRVLGDGPGTALSLIGLGNVALFRGDYSAARAHFAESLALSRQLGDPRASRRPHLAAVACCEGDYAAARTLLEEEMARVGPSRHDHGIGGMLLQLATVACRQGETEEARALLGESLSIHRRLGDKRHLVELLETFAELFAKEGQPNRAARLFGAAVSLRESSGYSVWASGKAAYSRCVAALREALGAIAFGTAWDEGRTLTWQQAVDAALEDGIL